MVTFTFHNGRTRQVTASEARLLERLNKGTYLTRDMRAQPPVASLEPLPPAAALADDSPPAPATAVEPPVPERDLDSLDVGDLRALAAHRGVKVHHNAGAAKIRDALRKAAS